MSKTDIVKRMNRDHIKKLRRFNAMPPREQRRVPAAYWSEHSCTRYAFEGRCLDCGRELISAERAV